MDPIVNCDENEDDLDGVVYAVIAEYCVHTVYERRRHPTQEAHCLAKCDECHRGQAEVGTCLDKNFAAGSVIKDEQVNLGRL